MQSACKLFSKFFVYRTFANVMIVCSFRKKQDVEEVETTELSWLFGLHGEYIYAYIHQ